MQAHCHYVVLSAFHEVIQSTALSFSNHAIMEALCALFAVFGMVEYAGEFRAVSLKFKAKQNVRCGRVDTKAIVDQKFRGILTQNQKSICMIF